ncbi:ABC transporter permease [bacterium]|nr:ABC transporter permease [bacterium]
MFAYIVRRALYAIPIMLGTTFLLFLLYNFVGGDPALVKAGKHATAETIATIRAEMGLDQPWYLQYWDLLMQVLKFDFGRSWSTNLKITDMVADGAGTSFSLTFPVFVMSTCLSLLLGIFVAVKRGSFIDKGLVTLAVGAQSISVLVYILAGQYFLAYKMGWFPISGYEPGLTERWAYFALPWLIYILIAVAPEMRFYRTIFLDELYQDYVRTAKSKGLDSNTILFKHVLRNALIPILTNLIISLPFLILGSLLLESFFGIPGLGGLIVKAIGNEDRPVIYALTVVGTIAYVIFNLISDILYAVVDPRVQLK